MLLRVQYPNLDDSYRHVYTTECLFNNILSVSELQPSTMNTITQVQKSLFAGSTKPCQTVRPRRALAARRVQASSQVSEEGFEMMRKGVKVAADETILTPRYVIVQREAFVTSIAYWTLVSLFHSAMH